jgi:hypothetical protein
VQEGLDYSYYSAKILPNEESKNTQNSISISVNPGLAYDLSKRIQFELLFLNDLLSASYVSSKSPSVSNGNPSTYKSNQFSFGANDPGITNLTSLNIGAKIFFGR